MRCRWEGLLDNDAAHAGVSTGLELDGDSLFLRGGGRVVNDGVDEGEEVHCNRVCFRGGEGAEGALREPERMSTKEIGACSAIAGPTYICVELPGSDKEDEKIDNTLRHPTSVGGRNTPYCFRRVDDDLVSSPKTRRDQESKRKE